MTLIMVGQFLRHIETKHKDKVTRSKKDPNPYDSSEDDVPGGSRYDTRSKARPRRKSETNSDEDVSAITGLDASFVADHAVNLTAMESAFDVSYCC